MTGPGLCSLSTLVILPVFCERDFNFEVLRPRCHLLLFYEPRESPFLKERWENAHSSRWLLLLLSRFSRVRLCATPETAAHQAPPSLESSRQEHWSGLPLPSPMHESEKWKGSPSVMSDSSRPHGLQPTRLLRQWDFPGKSTGVGCHCLLRQWNTTQP